MRVRVAAVVLTSTLACPLAGSAQVSLWEPGALLAERREQARAEEPFAAAGAVMISPPGRDTSRTPPLALPQRSAVEGMWIDFAEARWFSAGRAVDHDTSRFERVGDYRGFPVYRERGGPATRIYVTVTVDGPLAPFDRR